MSGCGARTAAGSLEAVFESSDVERFGLDFDGGLGGEAEGLRHRLQLAPGRLAEPAMRDFLKSVTEGKDKQVATDPRRFAVVEPPPFAPQVLEAERPKAIDLALDCSCALY